MIVGFFHIVVFICGWYTLSVEAYVGNIPYRNQHAIAAINTNNDLAVWGDIWKGGFLPADAATNVKDVCSTLDMIAVVKHDGTAYVWGRTEGVTSTLTGVSQISATNGAMAILLTTGAVYAFGTAAIGGNTHDAQNDISSQLVGITTLYSNPSAFAAVDTAGKVITWGDASKGGSSAAVASSLTGGVGTIVTNEYAIAALKPASKSVICWGDSAKGGSCSTLTALQSEVVSIFATQTAFVALKVDHSVIAWG